MILVPTFLLLFLRRAWYTGPPLSRRSRFPERVPFVLASSVASLSIVVVITEIGVHTGR